MDLAVSVLYGLLSVFRLHPQGTDIVRDCEVITANGVDRFVGQDKTEVFYKLAGQHV